MFSIIIPTYNNLNYLKLCLNSIKKNSFKIHEIILHINEGTDGTLDYAKSNNLKYTFSKNNIGLCSSMNLATKKSTKDYILYSHDDMYFCPLWDKYFIDELKKINHYKFYLSGTMIEPNSGHIKYNCGETINNFDENKLLNNYQKINFYDHQGTHFAPHLVHKKLWNKVGGFSEEFNPGITSDPDFNIKLWNEGVRIFKGINNCKVYHFSSVTTRKKKNFIQNKGEKVFLKKWGFSSKFFKKHYLRSETRYTSPLSEPIKNFSYFVDLFICKLKILYLSFFVKKI